MDARQLYIQKYTQRYGSAPAFLSPAPVPIQSDSQSNSDVTGSATAPPYLVPIGPRPVPRPMPVQIDHQPRRQPPGRGGYPRGMHRGMSPRVTHHRAQHSYGHRRRPVAVSPTVVPVSVATGKTCPTWGYMVRTNPDGSETVVQCAPGQPAAAGLHGLDGLLDEVTGTMQGALGPNWMLYLGGAAIAYFLFFKKRR